MLYTIFMKKTKGDKSPFAISVALNSYFKSLGDVNDIVIAFPGYMSRFRNYIDSFIKSISFPKNTYFTVGMNGNKNVNPKGNGLIQDAHNHHIKFHFTVTGLKNTNEDHAKMIFILNNPKGVNCIKASDLLTLDVKAVLIGSSNQSHFTYFNRIADKGEADLFIINGDCLKNANDSESQDKEILQFFNIIKYQNSEEINLKKDSDKILNNIALFKEFNKDTTINLKEILKQSIQGLLE